MPSSDRALWALRTWLDSWPGIGHVAVGMHRQGFDLQLTQYDDRGWRATFYTTGMEHSATSATGTDVTPINGACADATASRRSGIQSLAQPVRRRGQPNLWRMRHAFGGAGFNTLIVDERRA
jgi:hypothetical protein